MRRRFLFYTQDLLNSVPILRLTNRNLLRGCCEHLYRSRSSEAIKKIRVHVTTIADDGSEEHEDVSLAQFEERLYAGGGW